MNQTTAQVKEEEKKCLECGTLAEKLFRYEEVEFWFYRMRINKRGSCCQNCIDKANKNTELYRKIL